ncbi:MAG: TonB-dependent receptor [Candidatus Didemnitutus sp.]|nr:TonB-dependent receptor [Candidatus Didemnitutus sp.]
MKSHPCHPHAARARILALRVLAMLASPVLALAQSNAADPEKKDDQPLKLDKFVVTGSFIPQASAEPVGPVAVFTENEIRATGAFTPIQALRSLPSFIGNPGPTENDSNGGSGATSVSLRGLGAGQTLVLINGRVTLQFANIQLLPIEAIERVEVLRDGAGVIYGSSAIGGAVNVILKKNYSGSTLDVSAGGATRSPGGRETYQVSFATGVSNDKTSVVVTGSMFHNRTIYASERPNSAASDNRPLGGTNGGSVTYPGVISLSGAPKILRPNFPANATPTAADYVDLDTNGFSSNQLFNFRQYSPSAPGQDRNSFMVNFEHAIAGDKLTLFGNFLYSRLKTLNGLAPAPFALDEDPAGPAVGSLTSFGPYNQGILNPANGDFFRYRSIELGNRTNEQTYTDYRWIAGLRGQINEKWRWEAAMTIEREDYEQLDAGVPSLPLLDAEVSAGRFNPFAPAFSKGTATIGGTTYTWDNAKALKASEIKARIVSPIRNRFYDFRVSGSVIELPAGDLGFASGYETYSNKNYNDPDDLYASGSVLGLNSNEDSFTQSDNRSLFAEVKIPVIGEAQNIAFVNSLTIGATARNESQKIGDGVESRTFKKTNPSVNVHWAPTKDYLVRASWSKGFIAPASGAVFGGAGQNNPTIVDPLGFPYNAQTTIVIRPNSDLKPTESKAISLGLVGTPKGLVKNLSFSVDFYSIDVSGIVANNAKAILAANAAGQGSGFVPGNAATINPNAPFASLIRRSANGRLNSSGSFAATPGIRGAVLSDYLNIGSRKVQGLEYTVTYAYNTQDWGRFKVTAAANQMVKFDQTAGPGLPTESYLGKFVSTVGDPISPGSIPKWKGNLGVNWQWKQWTSNVTLNYIGSYQDDPLFVLSPKMLAFYNAGTPKSDPAFAAFLADVTQPKIGGIRSISAWETVDLQTSYAFDSDNLFLKDLTVTLGATNVFDKLAPFAAGAFNDSYDTRTHNNVGRFVYLQLRKQF